MAVTSVDLDPRLIERARELTGERSNRSVIDLALRRLIASKQKGAMIDGIAELAGLPVDAVIAWKAVASVRRDRLRRAGLRPTRQRLSLGWLLFGKGDRHLTAQLWRPYGEVEALEVPFLHPQMISPEAVVLIAPMLRAAMDRAQHRASPRSAAAE